MDKKLVFAIDMDGVLRDLFHKMCEVYNREYKDNLQYEDIDTWQISSYKKVYDELGAEGTRDWFFQTHGHELFAKSDILSPEIPALLQELSKYGKIVIVTWQRSKANKEDAIYWLDKFGIPYDEIYFTADKTDIRCDYMIDDRLDYLENSQCKHGILIDAPYNHTLPIDGVRIKRYPSIVTFINEFLLNQEHIDGNKLKDDVVAWIKHWFEENGPRCKAVVGMSGGKDSLVVAALCAEALGGGRVLGVGMPDEGQDLHDADKQAQWLNICFMAAPIDAATRGISETIEDECGMNMSIQAQQNLPPRIRMTMLYAISQSVNGRVAECGNGSENYIGYCTRYGDNVGDFSPLGNLTVTEVKAIGQALGLPKEWVEKTPSDDLPHSKSDEEKIGFSYATLDRYIRGIETPSDTIKAKIDALHKKNLFKTLPLPTFQV